jgi:hypothetical protein
MKSLYPLVDRCHPIMVNMKKHHLGKMDICRTLEVSRPYLDSCLSDHNKFTLKQLKLISSMIGMNVIELVYLLDRTQLHSTDKVKWYLKEVLKDKDI